VEYNVGFGTNTRLIRRSKNIFKRLFMKRSSIDAIIITLATVIDQIDVIKRRG
jgi:hypothetical protein